MDTAQQNELLLLMNVDNLVGGEVVKILAICSNMLNDDTWTAQVKTQLDTLFATPDFDMSVEMAQLIKILLGLSTSISYYKEIALDRMKYVLYASLYNYLSKCQLDALNNVGVGVFRVMFINLWSILEVVPESVKIAKTTCCSCFSQFVPRKIM